MKRRVVKKLINRYITPQLKGLPETVSRSYEIRSTRNGYGYTEVVDENHTIIDGNIVQEGCKAVRNSNKLSAIKKTADIVREIINTHEHVYVRIKPEVWRGLIYMRLITERKQP